MQQLGHGWDATEVVLMPTIAPITSSTTVEEDRYAKERNNSTAVRSEEKGETILPASAENIVMVMVEKEEEQQEEEQQQEEEEQEDEDEEETKEEEEEIEEEEEEEKEEERTIEEKEEKEDLSKASSSFTLEENESACLMSHDIQQHQHSTSPSKTISSSVLLSTAQPPPPRSHVVHRKLPTMIEGWLHKANMDGKWYSKRWCSLVEGKFQYRKSKDSGDPWLKTPTILMGATCYRYSDVNWPTKPKTAHSFQIHTAEADELESEGSIFYLSAIDEIDYERWSFAVNEHIDFSNGVVVVEEETDVMYETSAGGMNVNSSTQSRILSSHHKRWTPKSSPRNSYLSENGDDVSGNGNEKSDNVIQSDRDQTDRDQAGDSSMYSVVPQEMEVEEVIVVETLCQRVAAVLRSSSSESSSESSEMQSDHDQTDDGRVDDQVDQQDHDDHDDHDGGGEETKNDQSWEDVVSQLRSANDIADALLVGSPGPTPSRSVAFQEMGVGEVVVIETKERILKDKENLRKMFQERNQVMSEKDFEM